MDHDLDPLSPEQGRQMYLDERRHESADATLRSPAADATSSSRDADTALPTTRTNSPDGISTVSVTSVVMWTNSRRGREQRSATLVMFLRLAPRSG